MDHNKVCDFQIQNRKDVKDIFTTHGKHMLAAFHENHLKTTTNIVHPRRSSRIWQHRRQCNYININHHTLYPPQRNAPKPKNLVAKTKNKFQSHSSTITTFAIERDPKASPELAQEHAAHRFLPPLRSPLCRKSPMQPLITPQK